MMGGDGYCYVHQTRLSECCGKVQVKSIADLRREAHEACPCAHSTMVYWGGACGQGILCACWPEPAEGKGKGMPCRWEGHRLFDVLADRAEELEKFKVSEKELSDAYMDIRRELAAFDTSWGGGNRFEITLGRVRQLRIAAQTADQRVQAEGEKAIKIGRREMLMDISEQIGFLEHEELSIATEYRRLIEWLDARLKEMGPE